MKKISAEKMGELDRIVPEEYGIDVSRMMENAGYQIAEFIRKLNAEDGVTVYAGKGNNGGDALAAARRLHCWGYEVEVVLLSKDLEGIRKEELQILEALDVETTLREPDLDYPVALEGLIGYRLRGNPRSPVDSMIERVNGHEKVVSIDIPAGVEADTGKRMETSVEPDYTVTLGLPKKGMDEENSGEIWVADISIPMEVYSDFGVETSIFEEKSLFRL